MQRFEYKVIPAPKRAEKIKGVKGPEDRFAHTLMGLMNELGEDGWEYLRSETLPVEARSGLTRTTLTDQTVLVFRRVVEDDSASPLQLGEPLSAAAQNYAPRLDGTKKDAPRGKAPTIGAAN